MKVCSICGESKEDTLFRKIVKGKYTLSQCRSCESFSTKSRIKLRRDLLMEYKATLGCSDCGYSENPAALEFDHLPQFEKKFTIGTAVTQKGLEALAEEIAKCDVVCANCHRIRTLRRGDEKRTEDLFRLRERRTESVKDLVRSVQNWQRKYLNFRQAGDE